MELKELLNLIKKYSATFSLLFLIVFFGGLFFYKHQSQIYLGSVAVNISREGQTIDTQNYQYDQFYRLEADEKFGKNVVNWIGDPGLMNLNKVEFEKLKRGSWDDISKVKAIQASANYIKIEFKSKTPRSALVFGKVIKKNLNQKTEQLNIGQEKSNWFKLIIDEPQVSRNNVNVYLVLTAALCLGILLGILGMLLRHYFSKNENRD